MMRVLQVTPRVAGPATDGGRIAMKMMAHGLTRAGAEVHTLSLNPTKHHVDGGESTDVIDIDTSRLFRSALRSLRTQEPPNIARFWSQKLASRLSNIAPSFDILQLEELHLALYLSHIRRTSTTPVVLRLLNVESQVWHRMGSTGSIVSRLPRRVLARWIERFEQVQLSAFDGVVTVAGRDTAILEDRGITTPIHTAPVGLSLADYLVQTGDGDGIGLLGSLDYTPNIEALLWFLTAVWPRLRQDGFMLHVAGSGASRETEERVRASGAQFHGRVDDAKSFLQQRAVIAVPLLAGGGMRVRIVEAMALGCAVVSTSVGAENLGATDGENLLIADSAEEQIRSIKALLQHPDHRHRLGMGGRLLVEENFDAVRIGRRVLSFYEELTARRGRAN